MTKITLFVSDLQVSRRFYSALGFRVVARSGEAVVLALGDNALELRDDDRAVTGPHYFTPEISRFPRGTGVEITIETDALDQVFELALARDADFVRPLDTAAIDRTQILLSDPDGYLLRFVSPAPAPRRVAAAGVARSR